MTEATTTPAATDAKAKTVIDDMDSRRIFATTEEATAYMQKCAADFPDFGGYPLAIVGLTEDNEFDPAIYTDEMQTVVAVVTKRGTGKDSTSVHCIVVYPAPKLDVILASDQGRIWLEGIVAKELNHVAVRNIRKAESATDIAEAVETMPTSLADYVTSGREGGSGIAETYNELWQVIKKGIAARSKPFALANLSKKELRKSMESASYASTVYPQLEDRVNKKGEKESLFVLAATFGQMLAKQESLDPTIFERALATRDEKQIEVADDEEEFDLEAMAAALTKSDDEAAAETAPADSGESEAAGTNDATGE